MSKVFVTQYTQRANFSKASDFGEVIFLTSDEYRPNPVPFEWNSRIVAEMISKLSDYVPGHDYIMTTGSAIPNLLIGALMGSMPGATHKVLKWSNRMDGYEIFDVTFPLSTTTRNNSEQATA